MNKRSHLLYRARLILVAGAVASYAEAQNRSASVSAPIVQQRLTDAEFWRLISTFSEPGGTFTTENLTSNEVAVGQVATDLIARARTGGAYIGVGPEQNFTYIAALEPTIAFIVDIRRQAIIQHLMFKALFELSSTRAEFIERLFSVPPPQRPRPRDASIHDLWIDYLTAAPDSARFARNLDAVRTHLVSTHGLPLSEPDLASLAHVYGAFFTHGPAIHYLTGMPSPAPIFRAANFASLTMTVDTSAVARSFLSTERSFAFVKAMHERNMIIPIVGDFAGPRALRSVGGFLRANGTVVNAFYVSNVEQYLFRPTDKSRAFYDNVAALPLDSLTVLMRPGTPGSTALRIAPFTRQSSDSAAKAFIDQQRRPTPEQRPPPTALCPALRFLAAVGSGRVTTYPAAEACVR